MARPDLLLLAGAALIVMPLATPAAAQHAGHSMPMPPKAAPKKAAPKKTAPKKAIAKPAAKKPPPKKAPAKRRPAPRKPASATDPHAGHALPQASPPPAAVDPHAGHAMPDTVAAPSGTDLPAGNAPPPPVPADHAADAIYGAQMMQHGRHHLDDFHGGQKLWRVMVDRAETQLSRGRDGFAVDADAWYGGDLTRFWLKAEAEGEYGRALEKLETQALWSRAIDPYFNVQAGIRHDLRPDPQRSYAVVGVEGLAPSFFEVGGALFFSGKGELMARIEGEYDQRITQRLILQPRAELNFAAQDSRDIGVGSGLSEAETGLRLRYDIAREFSPYVGVEYRRAFGRTRSFIKDEGEDPAGWSAIFGLRAWF